MNQTLLAINLSVVLFLDATNHGRWVPPSLLAYCPLTSTKTLNGLQYHLQMYDNSRFLLHRPDYSLVQLLISAMLFLPNSHLSSFAVKVSKERPV